MNRITLTGSSGFVGKNLLTYLTKLKISVDTLSRRELALVLRFTNEDAIIHLAGKAHDLKKKSDPKEYYEVNYELTKKLYDAFLKSDAKKFIFMSSVKAAADTVNGNLSEDMLPNPKTDYGKSKLMAEEYIQAQPLPKEKSYYILRPCMIHGPGNKGNLNLLYKFVKKGIPYPLAAFENRRSFLSVENLCFVITNLLQKGIPSGVYQVSDDGALSTNEIVCILSESLKKKPKLWAIPVGLIKGLAKMGNVFKLPLDTERLHKLTENYIVSNRKIKEALGVDLPLSSKDGLKITASSFGSQAKK